MKKMITSVCRKCRQEVAVREVVIFKASERTRELDSFDFGLCSQCRKSLPQCDSCGAVIGAEWGYMEGYIKPIGRYHICGSCIAELTKQHFLHIDANTYILPDGSTVDTSYVGDEPLIIRLLEHYYEAMPV